MVIDHIGYAVKNIETSRDDLLKLGFVFEELFEDYDRNLFIQFGQKDGYRIELLACLDKERPSPVDLYIKNTGPTPYHICYKSESIDKDIDELKINGFMIVVPLAKAIAFANKRVVFMYKRSIGLIEIVES